MKRKIYILLILIAFTATSISSQIRGNDKGSPKLPTPTVKSDSLFEESDTIRLVDTLNIAPPAKKVDVKISNDSLPAPITYGAQDTQWLDRKENKIHLYGNAFVKFENYEINAGYIIFDFENSIAYGEGRKDQDGNEVEKPKFNDGNQVVNYNKLKYNFKTKKGLVYDAVMQEGEMYVLGATTKFVSSESDSLLNQDHIYNKNALITTCNHPHPHFGIRCSKLKVIPDKLAVAGPANLEIAGVKTPIVLPFGFFPINTKTISSGLIFPSDYEYNDNFGFGLREVGYYFPINERLDVKLTGDIYTRGKYALRLNSNYKKKYGYTGSINLGFSDNRLENSEGIVESNKSFSIGLRHNQDRKAHPYRSIDGTINISTKNYRTDNFNDATSILQNKYRSNLNFAHSLPRTPFNLTLGLSHFQDNNAGTFNMTLPDFIFNMNTIYPFKKKNRGGNAEKWYEKVNVSYKAKAKAFLKTQDSLLFKSEMKDDIQYGISQEIKTGASFRILKHFNLTPNASYDEIWFFRTLNKSLDTINPEIDTIIDDIIDDGTGVLDTTYLYPRSYDIEDKFVNNFQEYRNVNAGLTLSTQLFNTARFKKGVVRGLRHVMKPSLSFNFNPNTRERYQEVLFTDPVDIDDEPVNYQDTLRYNPFTGGVFGTQSLSEESMNLRYSIINIIEGKFFSKKDSAQKKVKLLHNLTLSGFYNFAADTLKWSPMSISGNTKLFKGLTSFQFNAAYDVYKRNERNQLINKTIWSEKKRPLQFNNLTGTLATSLRFTQIRDLFKGKDVESDGFGGRDDSSTLLGTRFDENPSATRFDPNFSENTSGFESLEEQLEEEESDLEDEALPNIFDLLDKFSLTHTYRFGLRKQSDGSNEYSTTSNSLTIRGKFDLTENWSIDIDQITYDFKNKKLVYPSLGFSRDLHCWTMRFRWVPDNGVYSFFIGAKSNVFEFMKYNYGQNR